MPRGRGENRQQQVAVASGSGQRFSQQRRPLKRCQREIQSLEQVNRLLRRRKIFGAEG